MSLLNYWPTATEVNQCIKPEAEGAHDSVLLAVHQPTPLTYKEGLHGEKRATTEDELYQYFLTPHVPTGAHVVPITGASGVGKSHLVRLLAARLQSENVDGRYVVIRIPKSASLRRVVELILEPLPDERYAGVKKEFEQALEEVNFETAAISFQAQLEIALGAREKELREQFRSNPSNQSLKTQIGHAKDLPRFFADPEVNAHFRETVFPRIVKRAVAGQGASAVDDPVEDFTAADFDLPTEKIDLSRTAASTRMYYSKLVAADGAGRREAAALLNERVVDQATGQLFKLHKQMGGMTLQDVILEIRRLLLKDNRELIILVEDFKALTGIQETLLNVLIQEGVRDGEKIYANMRSAIAVTDGYLEGQDTIATRAKREWRVESNLSSDADVLARTKKLVASYLNAARWGQEELKRHYMSRKSAWSTADAWIGAFKDPNASEATELVAFGKIDDIPLFPFTEFAIERLARMTLRHGDALVYTPRFIIDRILRHILLLGREAFAEHRFPPPSIEVQPAATEIAQWLASLPVSEDMRRRYERVVAIWGNAPTVRAEIGKIQPKIFKTFGLESPGIEAPPKPTPAADKTEKEPTKEPKKSTPVTELQGALENWVQKDIRLDQTYANQIRRSLAEMINERIDWNGERCVKAPIAASQISIPHASGEGNILETSIKIAPDNKDPDGRLRAELIALVRFCHYNKKQTDYEEVDDDLARVGNLVSRVLPTALQIVRSGVAVQLKNATKILTTNCRLLGLIEKGRTPQALSSFLFSPIQLRDKPPEGANQSFHEWRAAQDNAVRIRSRLYDLVLASCGSFQGAGRSAYGVDITRLVENFGGDLDKPDLRLFESLEPELKQLLSDMADTRIFIRAKKVYDEASRIKRILDAELGESFDKNEVADALKQLTDDMQDGRWDPNEVGQTAAKFKQLCEEFRAGALKEAFTTLQASFLTDDGKSDGKAISRIAQLDISPLIVAHTFVNAAAKVINAAQRQAKQLESLVQGVDPMAQANEIRNLLTEMVNDIEMLEAKGEKECC